MMTVGTHSEAQSTESPLVSVVIASVNGADAIGACLQALLAQRTNRSFEIVVADRCGLATTEAVPAFADGRVRWVSASPSTSIPRLRAMAMKVATGRLVAILEDHCNVREDWVELIARASDAGHPIVGGAVENGCTQRVRDWAAFFCEYSAFLPPLPGGVVKEITGNNSVYERALLEDLGIALDEEIWESFLHAGLKGAGVQFYCEPQLIVSHAKRFDFWYFWSQRFHYSRSFAAMRSEAWPLWKRMGYALSTALLPPLLLLRMARNLAPKAAYHSPFLRALPLIVLFTLPWAVGEAVGALAGAGDSLSRVE